MKDGLPFSILVVDNDDDDRFIIDQAFLKMGYASEVKKFINGDGLFQYLSKTKPSMLPSLIVLDNTFPDDDAEQTLIKLASMPLLSTIPIAVYTTFIPPVKREKLRELGVKAFFEKGSTMEETIKIMAEIKDLSLNRAKTTE